ncbi:unnamed protein product [Brassica oleracea]
MDTIGEGRHFERGLDTEMWKDGEVATQKAPEASGFAGAFEINIRQPLQFNLGLQSPINILKM